MGEALDVAEESGETLISLSQSVLLASSSIPPLLNIIKNTIRQALIAMVPLEWVGWVPYISSVTRL